MRVKPTPPVFPSKISSNLYWWEYHPLDLMWSSNFSLREISLYINKERTAKIVLYTSSYRYEAELKCFIYNKTYGQPTAYLCKIRYDKYSNSVKKTLHGHIGDDGFKYHRSA